MPAKVGQDSATRKARINYSRVIGEGAFKIVYEARYTGGSWENEMCVAKAFKPHPDISTDLAFEKETEIVQRAEALINAFNSAKVYHKRVVLNVPEIMKEGGQRLMVEPYLDRWSKFNSNTGACVDEDSEWGQVMQALSHFTYHVSSGQFLLCDLQGMPGQREIVLTDPVVLSRDRRFGVTDLGLAGMQDFFHSHRCNRYCSVGWQHPKRTRRHFPQSRSTSMTVSGLEVVVPEPMIITAQTTQGSIPPAATTGVPGAPQPGVTPLVHVPNAFGVAAEAHIHQELGVPGTVPGVPAVQGMPSPAGFSQQASIAGNSGLGQAGLGLVQFPAQGLEGLAGASMSLTPVSPLRNMQQTPITGVTGAQTMPQVPDPAATPALSDMEQLLPRDLTDDSIGAGSKEMLLHQLQQEQGDSIGGSITERLLHQFQQEQGEAALQAALRSSLQAQQASMQSGHALGAKHQFTASSVQSGLTASIPENYPLAAEAYPSAGLEHLGSLRSLGLSSSGASLGGSTAIAETVPPKEKRQSSVQTEEDQFPSPWVPEGPQTEETKEIWKLLRHSMGTVSDGKVAADIAKRLATPEVESEYFAQANTKASSFPAAPQPPPSISPQTLDVRTDVASTTAASTVAGSTLAATSATGSTAPSTIDRKKAATSERSAKIRKAELARGLKDPKRMSDGPQDTKLGKSEGGGGDGPSRYMLPR